ncbi:MAG: hypothetical protein KJZ65_10825 [Phycisphaerales bacterium]|nr:hypothetical protein [Phycisphaerales bacterium]
MNSYVVIASPESNAWHTARASKRHVIVLDPLRAPDAHSLTPLQPPTEGDPEHAIPRWAVYDCAEVPGAVIAMLRERAADDAIAPFAPLAVILAAPHAEPGDWHLFGLNLHSDATERTAADLIEAAIDLLDARQATLVLPWSDPTLLTLCERLGSVELLCAQVALHSSQPHAAVLMRRRGELRPEGLARPDLSADGEDDLALSLDRLRDRIEGGSRVFLEVDAAHAGRLAVREVAP